MGIFEIVMLLLLGYVISIVLTWNIQRILIASSDSNSTNIHRWIGSLIILLFIPGINILLHLILLLFLPQTQEYLKEEFYQIYF